MVGVLFAYLPKQVPVYYVKVSGLGAAYIECSATYKVIATEVSLQVNP